MRLGSLYKIYDATVAKTSLKIARSSLLRTFAPNFSNTVYFLEILPLKDDELVTSKM